MSDNILMKTDLLPPVCVQENIMCGWDPFPSMGCTDECKHKV